MNVRLGAGSDLLDPDCCNMRREGSEGAALGEGRAWDALGEISQLSPSSTADHGG